MVTIDKFIEKNKGHSRDGWLTMDKNGNWCFHAFKPFIVGDAWDNESHVYYYLFGIAPIEDWTKSLRRIGKMSWEELVEKAKKLGYVYNKEILNLDNDDFLYLEKRIRNIEYTFYSNGEIYINNFYEETCIINHRTPAQQWQIMLSLEDNNETEEN